MNGLLASLNKQFLDVDESAAPDLGAISFGMVACHPHAS
jgi:hypothetical protein